MKENIALFLGVLFLIDSFVFAFANVGKTIEWSYWFLPNFSVDAGMMIAFITFYAAVAGFLISFFMNAKN